MSKTEQQNNKYDSLYNKIFKRIIDIILSLILICILLPLILIFSLIIIFTDGFPFLYCPLRSGYKNKPFHIIKFRTMVKNADQIGGGTTALNDPRITKVGMFLRKTKIDEIPQLFNIFVGDMSFIGPRPELLKYTSQYTNEEACILYVKPGLTDFSSLEFINLDEVVGNINADDNYEKNILSKKNKLRMKYANNVSLKTDFKIFFDTVFSVIKKALKYIFKK